MLTKDAVDKMGRLNLRKKAMFAGMDLKASRDANDKELREYIFGNHEDFTNGKTEKPVPPKPLSDEEKAAKESGDAPVKRRGRPRKKKEETEKPAVKRATEETPSGDLSDLVNRLDVVGTVVDKMEKILEEVQLSIKHNAERLVDMESSINNVHRASFHIYTATVDVAESYDDIEEVPDPAGD